MNAEKTQLAHDVYATCYKLNLLLAKAAQEGLQVEINVQDIATFGSAVSDRFIQLRVLEHISWYGTMTDAQGEA